MKTKNSITYEYLYASTLIIIYLYDVSRCKYQGSSLLVSADN